MYHLIAQATSNDPGFGMDANVVVAHLTDRDVEWIEERMRQVRETPGCLSMDFQSPFNLRWGIQMVDGCRSTREMIDRVDRQNADGVEPPVETETIRINDGTFELLAIPTDRYNYQMLETDPVFLDELVAKGSLAVNIEDSLGFKVMDRDAVHRMLCERIAGDDVEEASTPR